MSRLTVVTLYAALVVATSSCGASGEPSDSASSTPIPTPTTNPCGLMTASTAQVALGEPASAGFKSDVGVVNGCVWHATGSNSDLVIVNIVDLSSFNAAKNAPSQSANPTVEAVPGLGDEAFYQTTGPTTLLEVRQGNAVVSIDVEKGGSSLPAAEKLVADVVVANVH